MRPVVRLLHTSDIHVAGDDASAGALRAVIDTAVDSAVDVVLIAGDLFDNARLDDRVVERTVDEMARLDQPVIVVPGNHDCVEAPSIWQRADLSAAGDHVRFVGEPAGERLVFEDLALAVWARGIERHEPRHRPLDGYQPADPGYWSVVVTHGHYVPTGEKSDRSSPITQNEISRLGCDYLALGHWHHFLDVSEGGVTAFYPGSPSDVRGETPTVNVVTLDPETGVMVERRVIGA
jgi:DNA repair exonuclease SbcCD nuclease subunit